MENLSARPAIRRIAPASLVIIAFCALCSCSNYDATNKLAEIQYRTSSRWDSIHEKSKSAYYTTDGLSIHVTVIEDMLISLNEAVGTALAFPEVVGINEAQILSEAEDEALGGEAQYRRIHLAGTTGSEPREAVVYALKTQRRAYVFIFAQDNSISDGNLKAIDSIISSIRFSE
ncbi:MAG: hypothetical protein FWG10_08285 [Eubacteriaceae bacterium]|nr:hypothetical protein [Eubacteriaceae bacterium]